MSWFAEVHLAPTLGVPIAFALAALLLGLWVWYGREEVPPSRRWIRRISIVIMLIALALFTSAMSFTDPDVQPRRYITMWTLGLGAMGVLILLAMLDALNTMRVHHLEQSRQIIRSIKSHAEAARSEPEPASRGESRGVDPESEPEP